MQTLRQTTTHDGRYPSVQILVLAWADNRKDLEVVWKVLSQVCLAYRADGGRVVVVLCSRDKLVRTLHALACTHLHAHVCCSLSLTCS